MNRTGICFVTLYTGLIRGSIGQNDPKSQILNSKSSIPNGGAWIAFRKLSFKFGSDWKSRSLKIQIGRGVSSDALELVAVHSNQRREKEKTHVILISP